MSSEFSVTAAPGDEGSGTVLSEPASGSGKNTKQVELKLKDFTLPSVALSQSISATSVTTNSQNTICTVVVNQRDGSAQVKNVQNPLGSILLNPRVGTSPVTTGPANIQITSGTGSVILNSRDGPVTRKQFQLSTKAISGASSGQTLIFRPSDYLSGKLQTGVTKSSGSAKAVVHTFPTALFQTTDYSIGVKTSGQQVTSATTSASPSVLLPTPSSCVSSLRCSSQANPVLTSAGLHDITRQASNHGEEQIASGTPRKDGDKLFTSEFCSNGGKSFIDKSTDWPYTSSVEGAATGSKESKLMAALVEPLNDTPSCYGATSFLCDPLSDPAMLHKLETSTDYDWDMSPEMCLSPKLTTTEPRVTTEPMMRDLPIAMAPTLIIRDQNKGDNLKQDIQQAVHVPSIRVVTAREAIHMCDLEAFQMIWVHFPNTGREDLLTVTTNIRYASKKNKNAHVIAITHTGTEDFHIHGIDEVITEPVMKETILEKYNSIKEATTKVGDSSIGVKEEGNSSASSMGFKPGEFSPGNEVNPSPSWCRVEHATKEKLRRERIKDSCDQLRVLLPYVRGRKTDMASILEMTVDYLKVVHASLPQDFHQQIIDMMNASSPASESQLSELDMSMTCKRINRHRSPPVPIVTLTKAMTNTGKRNLPKAVPARKLKSGGKRVFACAPSRVISSNLQNNVASNLLTNVASNMASNVASNIVCNVPITGSEMPTGQGHPSGSNSTGAYSPCPGAVITTKKELSGQFKHGGTSSVSRRPNVTVLSPYKDLPPQPSVVYLPTGVIKPIKETKREPPLDEPPSPSQPFSSLQYSHMFTDGDVSANRMFSTGHMTGNDASTFPQAQSHGGQQGTSTSLHPPDRGDHLPSAQGYNGMFTVDGNYYQYYQSLQDVTNGNFFMSPGSNEYVNPNAVIPVTSFSQRLAPVTCESRRHERRMSIGDTPNTPGEMDCTFHSSSSSSSSNINNGATANCSSSYLSSDHVPPRMSQSNGNNASHCNPNTANMATEHTI